MEISNQGASWSKQGCLMLDSAGFLIARIEYYLPATLSSRNFHHPLFPPFLPPSCSRHFHNHRTYTAPASVLVLYYIIQINWIFWHLFEIFDIARCLLGEFEKDFWKLRRARKDFWHSRGLLKIFLRATKMSKISPATSKISKRCQKKKILNYVVRSTVHRPSLNRPSPVAAATPYGGLPTALPLWRHT